MDIAITGASGLVGTALAESLSRRGDRPIALVRRQPATGADEIRWDPTSGSIDAASLEGIDAVVHLAGAGIGDKRWTDARKKLIWDSRIDGTTLLTTTLASLDRQPTVLASGSAIGFYGDRRAEELDEGSPAGTGFLADLVTAWEGAATPARDAGVRTVELRTGIVLSDRGGALKKQLPLFKLGLGGRLGSGRQWLSWISLDDEVRAIEFAIDNDIEGPINLTAPTPVTNEAFTKTLGSVLRRPTILPVPMFGPRLLFGKDMVEEALLASQNVLPKVLLAEGFVFVHATLETALRAILNKESP